MEVDDGDYATLRELPIPPVTVANSDDTASEEGKVKQTNLHFFNCLSKLLTHALYNSYHHY